MINKGMNNKIEKSEKEKEILFLALIMQCKFKNVKKIKELLLQGADINKNESYLLKKFACEGDYHLVKLLVESGADLSFFKNWKFSPETSMGSYSSHMKVIQYLIEQSADILNGALEYCIKYGVEKYYMEKKKIDYVDIIYLLESGAQLENVEFMNNFAYKEIKEWLEKYVNTKKLNDILENELIKSNTSNINKIKL